MTRAREDQSTLDALADAETLRLYGRKHWGQDNAGILYVMQGEWADIFGRWEGYAAQGITRAEYLPAVFADCVARTAHAAFLAVPALRVHHGDDCLDRSGVWSGTPIGDTAWTCDSCGETILATPAMERE